MDDNVVQVTPTGQKKVINKKKKHHITRNNEKKVHSESTPSTNDLDTLEMEITNEIPNDFPSVRTENEGSDSKVENAPISEEASEVKSDNNKDKSKREYFPGVKASYIYYSITTTDIKDGAEIISIALIDGNGRSFYAENTDYDVRTVSADMFERVIKNLDPKNAEDVMDGDHWVFHGELKDIHTNLLYWFAYYGENHKYVQLVGDSIAFSASTILRLLLPDPKSTWDMIPMFISPVVLDLNQDIASVITREPRPEDTTEEEYNRNYIPAQVAAYYDRKEMNLHINSEYVNPYREGTTLNWAYEMMCIHQFIWDLK